MYRGMKLTLLLIAVLVVAMTLAWGLRASDELYNIEDESDYFFFYPQQVAQGIEKIEFYNYIDEVKEWQDVEGTLHFYWGDYISFRAVPDPAGSTFPAGQPVWGGLAQNQTGEVVQVSMDDLSNHIEDFKTVSCEYNNTDDEASIIIYDVMIKGVGWMGLDGSIAVGETEILAAVLTPLIAGEFHWQPDNDKISFEPNEGQDVSVKGENISDSESDATFEFRFVPQGQGIEFFIPGLSLTVVGLEKMMYNLGEGWEDAPDPGPIFVPIGTSVGFRAALKPNTLWPDNKPVWYIGEEKLAEDENWTQYYDYTWGVNGSYNFTEAGEYTITAACGDSEMSIDIYVIIANYKGVWERNVATMDPQEHPHSCGEFEEYNKTISIQHDVAGELDLEEYLEIIPLGLVYGDVADIISFEIDKRVFDDINNPGQINDSILQYSQNDPGDCFRDMIESCV